MTFSYSPAWTKIFPCFLYTNLEFATDLRLHLCSKHLEFVIWIRGFSSRSKVYGLVLGSMAINSVFPNNYKTFSPSSETPHIT